MESRSTCIRAVDGSDTLQLLRQYRRSLKLNIWRIYRTEFIIFKLNQTLYIQSTADQSHKKINSIEGKKTQNVPVEFYLDAKIQHRVRMWEKWLCGLIMMYIYYFL